jgi:hypothetical protein
VRLISKFATTTSGNNTKSQLVAIIEELHLEFNIASVGNKGRAEVKQELAGEASTSAVVSSGSDAGDGHVEVSLRELYTAADGSAEVPVCDGHVSKTLEDLLKLSRVYMDSLSLQTILAAVQSAIFNTAATWQSKNRWALGAIHVQCDKKGSTVGISYDKKDGQDLRLYFAGVVTLTKTKSSIAICNIEGLPIYVSPGPHDKLAACFIPAWAVPIAPSFETATTQLKATKIELKLPSAVLKQYEGCHSSIEVLLEVPYLSVTAAGQGTITLLKSPTPSDFTTSDPTVRPSKGKGRGRGRSAKGSDAGPTTSAVDLPKKSDLSKKLGALYWLEKATFQKDAAPSSSSNSKKDAAHLFT